MIIFSYSIIYVFEAIISYIFITNKYIPKVKNKTLFLFFSCSAIIQFIIELVGNGSTNLLGFIACNLLICLLCYKTNILQSFFATILLAAIRLLSKMCVIFLVTLFLKTDYNALKEKGLIFTIISAAISLLYFFIAYLVSRNSFMESKAEFKINKTTALFFLPIASILFLGVLSYISFNFDIDEYMYVMFVIGTILLMYSNIVVFLVHEMVLQTQFENTSLKLQKQRSEIDTEYYSILQNQYENSNILIHDIKRHLLSIKELSKEKNFEAINNYIDNLYDNYQIKYLKKYSDNKLINAIINRFVNAYKEYEIDFYCDIRDIDFSFISDNDITSLLDNMLENALEATQNAENKKIELTIKPINTNYIAINIWNYCAVAPNLKDGTLQSTKHNKSIHGFGIKSIERIAKQYNGNVKHNFDTEEMKFSLAVVLKIK